MTIAEDNRSTPWGTTSRGEAVREYLLANPRGMRVRFLDYGGIITAIEVPDRNGHRDNVALGFASLADYEQDNASIYFGAIIGRYGNRIGGASFTLDGRQHMLGANDHGNNLHGGPDGFDRRLWTMAEQSESRATLTLLSMDGDQGFPGDLAVRVTYSLEEGDALRIDYEATTSAPTPVNLTNHSYFNLGGNGRVSALDHLLCLDADHFTPVDETLIPTGGIASVAGTPFDFRIPAPISSRVGHPHPQIVRAHGLDHNFVLNDRSVGSPAPAARLYDPGSGRILTVETTEPGIQVYSGNFLDGTKAGSAGRLYRQGAGVALETQHFPDSPNRPEFPSTILHPGETYRSTTIFRFSTDKGDV